MWSIIRRRSLGGNYTVQLTEIIGRTRVVNGARALDTLVLVVMLIISPNDDKRGISTLSLSIFDSIETGNLPTVSAFLTRQGEYRLIGPCSRYACKFLWHFMKVNSITFGRGNLDRGNRQFLSRYRFRRSKWFP